MTNLDSILRNRHYFADKGPSSQSYGFSNSHVWIWELDYKESWMPKNWCFGTVVLEKTFESPLDYKEIQPVNPKENQSWIFTGRTGAEAEAPILWSSNVKNWLLMIQGSNLGLLHCRQTLYQLSHQGSPSILEWVAFPFSRGSSQDRKSVV